jgi:hypothetical protein
MANICTCEIRATGSNEDIQEIKQLLNDHTSFSHGSEVTDFCEIVGHELDRGWGFRGHRSEESEDVLWVGELNWGPPGEFVKEIAQRYPDVTFEMKFLILDGSDRIEIYEFKGESSRLAYEADGTVEFCGQETAPVDHFRSALAFDSVTDEANIMRALLDEGLMVDDGDNLISDYQSEKVLKWIEARFPEASVSVKYWLPFRVRGERVDLAHRIAQFEFRDGQSEGDPQECHNWKADGF